MDISGVRRSLTTCPSWLLPSSCDSKSNIRNHTAINGPCDTISHETHKHAIFIIIWRFIRTKKPTSRRSWWWWSRWSRLTKILELGSWNSGAFTAPAGARKKQSQNSSTLTSDHTSPNSLKKFYDDKIKVWCTWKNESSLQNKSTGLRHHVNFYRAFACELRSRLDYNTCSALCTPVSYHDRRAVEHPGLDTFCTHVAVYNTNAPLWDCWNYVIHYPAVPTYYYDTSL